MKKRPLIMVFLGFFTEGRKQVGSNKNRYFQKILRLRQLRFAGSLLAQDDNIFAIFCLNLFGNQYSATEENVDRTLEDLLQVRSAFEQLMAAISG